MVKPDIREKGSFNKKIRKINLYLPSGPVNMTNLQEVLSSSKNEQQKHHQDNHGVTAIMAELKMDPDQIKAGNHTTSNKGPKQEK